MKHFIAMGGEFGCMPDNCSTCRSFEGAVSTLDTIYELSETQVKYLKAIGIAYLTREQGGAYCDVSECDCDTPWIHDEFGVKDDWPECENEESEEEKSEEE